MVCDVSWKQEEWGNILGYSTKFTLENIYRHKVIATQIYSVRNFKNNCVPALNLQIIVLIFINTERKMEGVYTNARKQLLISSVPAILILHLKRFHQVKGPSFFLYSSAMVVAEQLFKCHCAYQCFLFIWRTGRTTIYFCWEICSCFFESLITSECI